MTSYASDAVLRGTDLKRKVAVRIAERVRHTSTRPYMVRVERDLVVATG
jgi:hypothetical protein